MKDQLEVDEQNFSRRTRHIGQENNDHIVVRWTKSRSKIKGVECGRHWNRRRSISKAQPSGLRSSRAQDVVCCQNLRHFHIFDRTTRSSKEFFHSGKTWGKDMTTTGGSALWPPSIRLTVMVREKMDFPSAEGKLSFDMELF